MASNPCGDGADALPPTKDGSLGGRQLPVQVVLRDDSNGGGHTAGPVSAKDRPPNAG